VTVTKNRYYIRRLPASERLLINLYQHNQWTLCDK